MMENQSTDLLECRICLQSDNSKNLIIPCECKGSQKYSHKICLKQWMDIKHSDKCGVCKQPYSGIFFTRKPDHFFHYLIDNEGALIEVSQGLRIILLLWTTFYALLFGFLLFGALIALRNGFRIWSSTHFIMEMIQDDDDNNSSNNNSSSGQKQQEKISPPVDLDTDKTLPVDPVSVEKLPP
ncbi:E3 ubiquitin-protein ligase MARCHF11-like isoform X1 [Panonychus citri]|uniref:E3 ubiquitin-protein ligase MARCHF11-like isoform X1 n=1 Tax=Panonychus citri TaxID=50023 RepID=UPI002307D4D4|nr:E3 ubiquitin-protein ligase MARCHF11-like isoform X1 [Panonychus citri]XP_053206779.1 E3 ubiquitin-protein ligase MARCHF11-like isoform X1 [Panonychus citri]